MLPRDSFGWVGPGPRGSEPAGLLRCPGLCQLAPGAACEQPGCRQIVKDSFGLSLEWVGGV